MTTLTAVHAPTATLTAAHATTITLTAVVGKFIEGTFDATPIGLLLCLTRAA